MKILFLDFDGVLNNTEWWSTQYDARKAAGKQRAHSFMTRAIEDIDPENVANLEKIMVGVPGLQIVISSTWRKLYKLPDIREFLKLTGGKISHTVVIDRTPDSNSGFRGKEIQWWLDNFADENTDYVILDDDGDMLDHQKDGHFVHTDPSLGLTAADAEKAITILNPLFLQKNQVESNTVVEKTDG